LAYSQDGVTGTNLTLHPKQQQQQQNINKKFPYEE
jgi:hypothetical protein